MLRHWVAGPRSVPVHLLYSSRALDEVIYREELLGYAASFSDRIDVRFALTREWPEDYTGHTGRIDHALLAQVAGPPQQRPLVYVCGPSGFVEVAANWLVELGHASERVRTERFGPTGT